MIRSRPPCPDAQCVTAPRNIKWTVDETFVMYKLFLVNLEDMSGICLLSKGKIRVRGEILPGEIKVFAST